MPVFVGDVGTRIDLTVMDDNGEAYPIPSDAVKKIFIRKPNSHVVEKTAVFITNGSDGKVRYVIVAGDFDQAGEYQAQAWISSSDGKFSSTILPWTVEERLRNRI